MIALRPYQERAVEALAQAWRDSRRVLLALPTGSGKTEVAIAVMLATVRAGERAMVVVDRKVLTTQWVARLERHFPLVGVLQADNTRRTYAPVLVATAQTIRARGVPDDVHFVVIDESHIWHRTHDDVLGKLGDARVLGLTATPLREGLGLRFERMVVGATIRELIADDWLVPSKCYAPRWADIERGLESVAVVAGDFKAGGAHGLGELMRERKIIGDVVGTWLERAQGRATIAFCVDKAHARDLADQFVLSDVPAAVVVDETPDDERAEIFAGFERGEVRVLCSVGVLSIGFDSPRAACAILARPTLSRSLHIQQVGRVLRPFEGKADALVLDHAGNVLRHGTPEDFVPPADLSLVDKRSDKCARNERSEYVICRHCAALFERTLDVCPECGTTRRRQTVVCVVDGELVAHDLEPGRAEPGPRVDALREFYRMALGHAERRGLRAGWAYFATLRKFGIDPETAKRARPIPYDWQRLPPLTPDADASRWFQADFQRERIAWRARQGSAAA